MHTYAKNPQKTRLSKSLASRMPSDVAPLLSPRLLSSSFQVFFFSFLTQTPPLRPCCRAVDLSPPSPVSDLVFISFCVSPSFSAPLPLRSRVWVLLGERCATKMMSHAVTLSSPPLLLFLLLFHPHPAAPQHSLSLTKQSTSFSLQDKLGSLARAVGWYEGHASTVISSLRTPLPLTETSNHHFLKSSRRHINRRALADVSLPRCLKLP